MTSSMVLLILLLYAVIMYLISRRTRKQNQSFEDTIAAPRRATLLLVTGSAIGGQIGSGFVMGGGEYGAQYGLSGAWYGIGCGLSYFVTVLLAKFIHEHHLVSLTDYFSQRYQGTTIRLIYSTTGILSCIAMISGQLLASRAIFVTLGFPPQFGVIVTAIFALAYANTSGLLGTMAISSFQSTILFVGMITALWLLCFPAGFAPLLHGLPDSAFEVIPPDKEFLLSMAGPIILASAVNQISFQCITSAKSVRTAQGGYLLAGLFLIPCAFIAPILGMFGRFLFPEAASQQVFSTLLLSQLPVPLAAVIFAAVICSVVISCTSAYTVQFLRSDKPNQGSALIRVVRSPNRTYFKKASVQIPGNSPPCTLPSQAQYPPAPPYSLCPFGPSLLDNGSHPQLKNLHQNFIFISTFCLVGVCMKQKGKKGGVPDGNGSNR